MEKKQSRKSHWTQKHIHWLLGLFGKRIQKLSMGERYEEKTRQLCCFRGIAAHTALSILIEIGDFSRVPTAKHFASFLGLTPSEHSSGESQHNGAITKAGNSHLRRLLIESSSHYSRWAVGKKSIALKKRKIRLVMMM